jgi:hypothetical protein
MVFQFTVAVALGILLARAVEWLFVALIKTIVVNWLYYRPLLAVFFIQLKNYRKSKLKI